MPELDDYYRILKVPRDADLEAIKTSYRQLARKFHPDKNNNSAESTRIFAEIENAYDTLSDPLKRTEFDLAFTIKEFHELNNLHNAFGPLVNAIPKLLELQERIHLLQYRLRELKDLREAIAKTQQAEEARKKAEIEQEKRKKDLAAQQLKETIYNAIRTNDQAILNVNNQYDFGIDEVFYAIQQHQSEALKWLLEQIFSINEPRTAPHSSEKIFCITEAILENDLSVLQVLLNEKTLDITVKQRIFPTGKHCGGYLTALGLAVFTHDAPAVDAIFSSMHASKVDLNEDVPNDSDGFGKEKHLPLLIYASINDDFEIVDKLLQAGAYANIKSVEHLTALYYVVRTYSDKKKNAINIIDALLRHEASVNDTFNINEKTQNILKLAAEQKNLALLIYLLEQKHDIFSIEILNDALSIAKKKSIHAAEEDHAAIYNSLWRYRKKYYRFNWFKYTYHTTPDLDAITTWQSINRHSIDFKNACKDLYSILTLRNIIRFVYRCFAIVASLSIIILLFKFRQESSLDFLISSLSGNTVGIFPSVFTYALLSIIEEQVVNKLELGLRILFKPLVLLLDFAFRALSFVLSNLHKVFNYLKGLDIVAKGNNEANSVSDPEIVTLECNTDVQFGVEDPDPTPILHKFDAEQIKSEDEDNISDVSSISSNYKYERAAPI